METDKNEPDFAPHPPPLVVGVINRHLGDAQKEKITSETSTFLPPLTFDWTYFVYFSEPKVTKTLLP